MTGKSREICRREICCMTPLCFFFFAVIDVKSNISLRRNDDKRGVSGDLSCCVLMLIRILLGLRLIRHIEIAIIKKKKMVGV